MENVTVMFLKIKNGSFNDVTNRHQSPNTDGNKRLFKFSCADILQIRFKFALNLDGNLSTMRRGSRREGRDAMLNF